MRESLKEDRTKEILSSFSCPLNADIEYFIKDKAVEFSKQGIAETHLVLAQYKGSAVLVGYYTLANKTMVITRSAIPSERWRKRINKFAIYNPDLRAYTLSIPLIAQLGKNYTEGYNKLISGDELLKMACDKVVEICYGINDR